MFVANTSTKTYCHIGGLLILTNFRLSHQLFAHTGKYKCEASVVWIKTANDEIDSWEPIETSNANDVAVVNKDVLL